MILVQLSIVASLKGLGIHWLKFIHQTGGSLEVVFSRDRLWECSSSDIIDSSWPKVQEHWCISLVDELQTCELVPSLVCPTTSMIIHDIICCGECPIHR